MKKKGGFTLLELMIVCGIILILSCWAYAPIADRMEKNAVMEAKTKIAVTLQNISDKADYYGVVYDIRMDFEEKRIAILKDEVEIEKIELPKILEYEDIAGKKVILRRTTPTGNMSKSFSIYITSKKNVHCRITVDTTSPTKAIFIRKYKPTEKITFENYKEENFEKIVWIRE